VKLDEQLLGKLRSRGMVSIDYVSDFLKDFQMQPVESKFPAAEAYIEKLH
jgi:hypothetical protein